MGEQARACPNSWISEGENCQTARYFVGGIISIWIAFLTEMWALSGKIMSYISCDIFTFSGILHSYLKAGVTVPSPR
jgi:hypothetical protein